MKRAVVVVSGLLGLALTLSGCSVTSLLPSTNLVSATPTPAPTVPPTAPPIAQAGDSGFDNNAGNCADAANTAISLISQTAAGHFGSSFFNMDMNLALEPHVPTSGCDDSAHVARYRRLVGSATLTVWALDFEWSNAGPIVRQQWLAEVMNVLSKQYPAANVTIQVLYNNVQCGTASIGPGKSGAPQIDPNCA